MKPLLDAVSGPLVVAGDYNQRIPRRRAPHNVFKVLSETFSSLQFASDSVDDDPLIDHISHSWSLEAHDFKIIPSTHDGRRLTDHRGLFVDLDRSVGDIA